VRGARELVLAITDSLLAARGCLLAVRVRPDVRTLHDGPAPEVMESSGHRAPALWHTVGLWCHLSPLPVFRRCTRVGHCRGPRAACGRISNPNHTSGCRFSESLNTVKDVAEESISKDYSSLISDTEKSVKKDMNHEFSSYGHTMWDLNK
jgi:hypothetical protein